MSGNNKYVVQIDLCLELFKRYFNIFNTHILGTKLHLIETTNKNITNNHILMKNGVLKMILNTVLKKIKSALIHANNVQCFHVPFMWLNKVKQIHLKSYTPL